MSRVALALALAALGLAAPARADAPPLEPAIYGGRDASAGELEAVVAVFDHGEVCTGTLLTPRVVLTAAHCLGAELPQVYYGTELVQGREVAVAKVGRYPKYCDGCETGVRDFGFVLLAEDLDAKGGYPAVLASQEEWDAAIHEGAKVTLVGYGEDGDPQDPYAGAGHKRVVDTTIRSLADDGLELLVGGGGRGTCDGDSGGPLLVRAPSGALRVAGVLERGTCGDRSLYGVPYPALCWLSDQTGAALRPHGCGTCDCLDTQPGGCGCGVVGGDGGGQASAMVAVLGALALGARRRRREGTGSSPQRPAFRAWMRPCPPSPPAAASTATAP